MKKILLITLAVILGLFSYSYYSYSKIKVNNIYADEFSQHLIQVVLEQEEFDMTQVTKFDWDKMIVFGPYTSREEMEKQLGQEWTTYSYTDYYIKQKSSLGMYPLSDDSLNKIVFIKGQKVVADVTFYRSQVDLTLLNQTVNREEAKFSVEDGVLRQVKKPDSSGSSDK